MEFSYEDKCSLRYMGWMLVPNQGRGPESVRVRDVLRIGEDVHVPTEGEGPVVDLAERA